MSETVICHYRVAAGNENRFEQLLAEHWPTLKVDGLCESRGGKPNMEFPHVTPLP